MSTINVVLFLVQFELFFWFVKQRRVEIKAYKIMADKTFLHGSVVSEKESHDQ